MPRYGRSFLANMLMLPSLRRRNVWECGTIALVFSLFLLLVIDAEINFAAHTYLTIAVRINERAVYSEANSNLTISAGSNERTVYPEANANLTISAGSNERAVYPDDNANLTISAGSNERAVNSEANKNLTISAGSNERAVYPEANTNLTIAAGSNERAVYPEAYTNLTISAGSNERAVSPETNANLTISTGSNERAVYPEANANLTVSAGSNERAVHSEANSNFTISAGSNERAVYSEANSNLTISAGSNERFVQTFNEELQARNNLTKLVQRLPMCIIIGVQKGGTGALIEFLDIHPDLAIRHREGHFFDKDKKYRKGLSHYKSLMPLSLPNQITIEKTPAYFHTEKVPRRVNQMNSSVRLLLTVRNPLTRVLSQYAMSSARDPTLPPIRSMLFDAQGNVNSKQLMINMSTYHVHFSRWLEYFPKQNIHIVDGENLILNPYSELFNIESFLGIGHKLLKHYLYFDSHKGFYCMIRNNVSKCLSPQKGIRHPELSDDELEKLRKYFEPLNERFFKLVDRRFNWE